MPHRRLILLVCILVLTAGASGCAVYFADEFIEQNLQAASLPATVVRSEKAVLAWDPPPQDVKSYQLYFRIRGEEDWVLLDTVPAAEDPKYTIRQADFGDGEFEFGVIAVSAETGSEMHTSLDATASPRTGWYLRWEE